MVLDRLKVIYVLSILIFIPLLIFFIYSALMQQTAESPSAKVLTKVDFVKHQDFYVADIGIINNEKRDMNFTIDIIENETLVVEYPILISGGGGFNFRRNIYPDKEEKKVTVAIYRENETAPIKEYTYMIGPKG